MTGHAHRGAPAWLSRSSVRRSASAGACPRTKLRTVHTFSHQLPASPPKTMPAVNHGDAVTDLEGEWHLVRDDDGRDVEGALGQHDQVRDAANVLRVEARGRLVVEPTSGRTASARASPTRFFIPVDRSLGHWSSMAPRPTYPRASATRRPRRPRRASEDHGWPERAARTRRCPARSGCRRARLPRNTIPMRARTRRHPSRP